VQPKSISKQLLPHGIDALTDDLRDLRGYLDFVSRKRNKDKDVDFKRTTTMGLETLQERSITIQ